MTVFRLISALNSGIKSAASFQTIRANLRHNVLSRTLATKQEAKKEADPTEQEATGPKEPPNPFKFLEEFKPIYKFPYISMARTASKLKILQTFLLVSMVPASIVQAAIYGQVSVVFVGITGMAIFSTITLYAMGELFFRRVIGFVYVSKDGNIVRVAHLDFWGNRKDIEFPVEDVAPLFHDDSSPHDIYFHLCRYSTKDKLFLSLRYGQILDKQAFYDVFGYAADEPKKESKQ